MLYLAADHAGYSLKQRICAFLEECRTPFIDLGTDSERSVDWPLLGARGAEKVAESPGENQAILICGTGIGMSMVANKFPGVRAALCHDENDARMSRRHNNANCLTLGARVTEESKALQIVDTWLKEDFEGGRHAKRLSLLNNIEYRHFQIDFKGGNHADE